MSSSRRGGRIARVLGLLAWWVGGGAVWAVGLVDYLPPLRAGVRWEFAVTGGGTVVRDIAGTTTVPGAGQVHALRTSDGVDEVTHWTSVDQGLRVFRIDYPSDFASIVLSSPVVYLPTQLEVGQVHRSTAPAGIAFLGQQPDGFSESLSIQSSLDAVEVVTVPAGTFECVRVRVTEGTNPTQTWWMARGLGTVKQSTAGGSTWELKSTTLDLPKSGPIITRQPAAMTVTAGAEVTLTVEATGAAPLAYQWRKGGQAVAGATATTLVRKPVTESDAGDYSVVVSNVSGSVTSVVARLTVNAVVPAVPLKFVHARATAAGPLELRFSSEAGKSYRLEGSVDLKTWADLQLADATGTETALSVAREAAEAARFYRLRVAPAAGGGVLTLPVPGQLYPASTRLGGSLFGIEFAIPPEWKGGLRVGSVFLVFGSDTRPGLVLGVLGFAGRRADLLADESLRSGFETALAGGKTRFVPSLALRDAGPDRMQEEFTGQSPDGTSYWMGLDFLLHPDGGYLGFLGITTIASRDSLRVDLEKFVTGARTTRRPTNTALMESLGGRKYQWANGGNDWYKGDLNQKTSLSSWSESFAFFCRSGTMEINKTSTGYASASNSGGWSSTYMSLSYDETTKEYGQFTIVTDPQYGDVLLLSTLGGYQAAPIRLNADGSLLVGQQRLAFQDVFRCAGD